MHTPIQRLVTVGVILVTLILPIQPILAGYGENAGDLQMAKPLKKGGWGAFEPVAAPEVGTLPGTFDVNPYGAGTYQIPIDVPPGSAEVQPSISLNYNSQNGNGLLGMGWNIGGLSEITRCGADKMHDGFIGSVKYNSNDRFCLDGKRLIAITGADGANGTVYRTDPDEFSRVTSYGTAGSGPAYFEVRTKDGMIYEYGGDATRTEGRIEAELRTDGSVRVWAVNLIQNRKGAYMDFTYDEDVATREYSPYEIHYTGNFSIGQPTYNKIQFTYQGRPDTLKLYDGGSLVQTSRRITSIKTYININTANPSLVSDYQLAYELGAATQRSRLISIKKCGPYTCLPATTFVWTGDTNTTPASLGPTQWGAGFGGLTHITEQWIFSGVNVSCCSAAVGVNGSLTTSSKGDSASVGFQAGVTVSADFHRQEYDVPQDLLGDFNGDGKQDVVQIQGSSGRAFAWLSNGNGFTNIGTEANPSATGFNGAGAIVETLVADFNGDGWDDLAWFPDWAGQWPAYVWISQGNGFFSGPTNWGNQFSLAKFLRVADFNGDGKADLATLNEEAIDPEQRTLAVWLSTGSSFTSSSLWRVHTGKATLGDFNGDGMTDAVTLESTASQPVKVHLSNGTGFDPAATWLTLNTDPEDLLPFVGDFNGDGKDDLGIAHSIFDINQVVFHLSDGAESFVPQPALEINDADFTFINCFPDCAPKGDFVVRQGELNGDGKTDLLRLKPTAISMDAILSRNGTWSSFFNWGGSFFGDLYEYAMGDVDGDGRSDVIRFAPESGVNPAKVWSASNTEYPDLLKRITNGYGHQTNVVYKPLTDQGVYSGPTSNAGFDQYTRSTQDPQYVVGWFTTSNGLGTNHKKVYTYSGLKEHTGYRTSLGFDQIEIYDVPTGVTQRSNYYQVYPLRGVAKSVTLDGGSGVGVYSTINDNWNAVSVATGSGVRYKNQLASHYEKKYDTTVFQEVISDDYQYDSYNNVTHWRKKWTGVPVIETHDFVYDPSNNDPSQWLIGLPSEVTIGETIVGNPYGYTRTRTVYRTNNIANGTGLLTHEQIENTDTGNTLDRNYFYDPYGNLDTTQTLGTDIATRVVTTHYDGVGQFPQWQRNEKVQQTNFTFDQRFGGLLNSTDPNGLVITNGYDNFGRLVITADTDGSQKEYSYNTAATLGEIPINYNHSITITRTNLPTITKYYDNNDRELRVVDYAFGGQKRFNDTVYDLAGRIDKKSTPYYANTTPVWTQYHYDVQGRPTQLQTPTSGATNYYYYGNVDIEPSAIRTNQPMQYQVVTVNSLNQTYVNIFDGRDHLIQSLQIDDLGNPLAKTTYLYDGFGNLIETEDAGGNITNITFDPLGRKTDFSNSDLGTQTFSYDMLGNMVSSDVNGKQTQYTYDLLNRPLTQTQTEGQTSWTYDGAAHGIGRLNHVTAPSNYSRDLTYDTLGRLQSATTGINGTNYAESMTYDNLSRVKTVTYPGSENFSLRYLYNANGYLSTIQTNTTPFATNYWVANSMNAVDQVTNQTLGNGVVSSFTYDPLQLTLKDIVSGVGGGSSLQNLHYVYDNIGKLQSRNDSNLSGDPFEVFHYDAVNRLKSTELIYSGCGPFGCTVTTGDNGSGGGPQAVDTIAMSYDADGNILTKNGVGTYTYGQGAGAHAVTSITNGGSTVNYQYDASGNLTGMPGVSLTWDTNNKPKIITQGADQWQPLYSPDGRKYKETHLQSSAPVDTTVYIDQLYEKTSQSSGASEERYYVFAGQQLIALYTKPSAAAGDTKYFNNDPQGSPNVITNSAGALLEKVSFDSFGKRRNANWTGATGPITSLTRHGYTGHEHFDEFGLIDAQGRLYNPTIGRFVSADPTVPDPVNTQDWNRYSYVRNSPVNYIDPTGYDPCDPDCGGGTMGPPTEEEFFDNLDANTYDPNGFTMYDPNSGIYRAINSLPDAEIVFTKDQDYYMEQARRSVNGDNLTGWKWFKRKVELFALHADDYFKTEPEWMHHVPPVKLAESAVKLTAPESTLGERLEAGKDLVELYEGPKDIGEWLIDEAKDLGKELLKDAVDVLLSPNPEGVQQLEPPANNGRDNTYVAPVFIPQDQQMGPQSAPRDTTIDFYQRERF